MIGWLFAPIVALSLVVPALVGWAWIGGRYGFVAGLVWGGAIRILLLHHVTWSINSICHFWGRRRFAVQDESRNVWWVCSPVLAGTLALFTGATAVRGCLNRPLEPNKPRITSTVQERLPQSKINKIDLLLMIDNSASMGDKQAILASAVPISSGGSSPELHR